jgi:hypothetical protein
MTIQTANLESLSDNQLSKLAKTATDEAVLDSIVSLNIGNPGNKKAIKNAIQNPAVGKVALKLVLASHYTDLAEQVINHPKITHDDLLEAFEKGVSDEVLDLILTNFEKCPVELLEHFSESVDRTYLKYVAMNPRTPFSVLTKLAIHPNRTIRDYAFESLLYIPCNDVTNALCTRNELDMIEATKKGSILLMLYAAAQNPFLTERIFYRLVKSRNRNVRIYVAQNPKLPKDLCFKLAKSKKSSITRVLASNKALTKDIINFLAGRTKDKITIENLLNNPNADAAELKAILEASQSKDTTILLAEPTDTGDRK